MYFMCRCDQSRRKNWHREEVVRDVTGSEFGGRIVRNYRLHNKVYCMHISNVNEIDKNNKENVRNKTA